MFQTQVAMVPQPGLSLSFFSSEEARDCVQHRTIRCSRYMMAPARFLDRVWLHSAAAKAHFEKVHRAYLLRIATRMRDRVQKYTRRGFSLGDPVAA
jgi:hypothetical protein